MYDDLQDDNTTMTQREEVSNKTGIAADDMYRMSRQFTDYICHNSWSLDAHRVFHAVLHRTCRALPGWSEEAVQPEEGYRIRAIRLRETVGLEAVNGNRNLRAGVAVLQSTGIFDWIGFLHRNEFLAWRYREEVLAAILENGVYALLDASALPKLTCPIAHQIFCQVSQVRRMRKPRFRITVPHVGIWIDRDTARWSDVSKGVISALQVSCAHYGLTACVLLDRRGMLRGIDTVEVRLRQRGSLWSVTDMAKLNPETTKCLVVDSSGYRTLGRGDFPDFVGRLRDARWRLGDIR